MDVIITEPEEPTPPTDEQTATMYIGTKAGGFNEYPMAYEGELTPEKLIQGIADLTGWNLTLAENVVSGKSGMSVYLSSESSLFTGPPDPQREEFHMYDVGQLAERVPLVGGHHFVRQHPHRQLAQLRRLVDDLHMAPVDHVCADGHEYGFFLYSISPHMYYFFTCAIQIRVIYGTATVS